MDHRPNSDELSGLFGCHLHIRGGEGGYGCGFALIIFGVLFPILTSARWDHSLVAAAIGALIAGFTWFVQPSEGEEQATWTGLVFGSEGMRSVTFSDCKNNPGGLRERKAKGVGNLETVSDWESRSDEPFSYSDCTLVLSIEPDATNQYKVGRFTLLGPANVAFDYCDTYISGDQTFVATHEATVCIVDVGAIHGPWKTVSMDSDAWAGMHLVSSLKALASFAPPDLKIVVGFHEKGSSALGFGLAGGVSGGLIGGAIGGLAGMIAKSLRHSKLSEDLRAGRFMSEEFCTELNSLVAAHGWTIANLSAASH